MTAEQSARSSAGEYVRCGHVDPVTLHECINVRPRGATRCAGPHRCRAFGCDDGCILDAPHRGETCLVGVR